MTMTPHRTRGAAAASSSRAASTVGASSGLSMVMQFDDTNSHADALDSLILARPGQALSRLLNLTSTRSSDARRAVVSSSDRGSWSEAP